MFLSWFRPWCVQNSKINRKMSTDKPSDQQDLAVPVIPPDKTPSVPKRVQTKAGRAHEVDLLAEELNACY